MAEKDAKADKPAMKAEATVTVGTVFHGHHATSRPVGQPEGPPGCCQGVSPPWLPGGVPEDDAVGYRRGFRASTFGLDGTDLSGGPVTYWTYPGES